MTNVIGGVLLFIGILFSTGSSPTIGEDLIRLVLGFVFALSGIILINWESGNANGK